MRKIEACQFCGVKVEWGYADKERGSIWDCEECKKKFCVKCFEEKHGHEAYLNMMCKADYTGSKVLCPECYEVAKNGNQCEH